MESGRFGIHLHQATAQKVAGAPARGQMLIRQDPLADKSPSVVHREHPRVTNVDGRR